MGGPNAHVCVLCRHIYQEDFDGDSCGWLESASHHFDACPMFIGSMWWKTTVTKMDRSCHRFWLKEGNAEILKKRDWDMSDQSEEDFLLLSFMGLYLELSLINIASFTLFYYLTWFDTMSDFMLIFLSFFLPAEGQSLGGFVR